MRKPTLTKKVRRGLASMVAYFSSEDLKGMQQSGIIESVDDVIRAMQWVWEIRDYYADTEDS